MPNTSWSFPYMKTNTTLLRWLLVAAGLLAACNIVSAATYLTIFTDSWKDAGTNESASTTGSFTINLSVPLGGVDLSEADSNSLFSLSIGIDEDTMQIISTNLGNAQFYSPGQTSATLALTALDGEGNEITNGSVTVSWTATNITVAGSTTGDLLGQGANFAYNSQYGSAKSSRFSIEYYEVILTLDASDNGGGTFTYDNPYVQVIGHNAQTTIKPADGSGTYYLETGSLIGADILTPPKLTISSPALNFKVYDANPVVDLIGNASDSLGITNIQCYVNGDTTTPVSIDQSYEFPTNQVSWTAEVDLSQFGQVGTNVISVVAQDVAGNQTVVSRAFLWIETNAAVITVNPTGAGAVKGIKNGQVLQVNNGYVVTATPANKNWIFSEWTDGSGDVLSSNATFEYFDLNGTWTNSSPPTLVANFVANPFNASGMAGTYTGLFDGGLYYYYDLATDPRDSGYITVTVTEAGNYSGKLYVAASATPCTLSGQFSVTPDGSMAMAESVVKVGKSELLDVNLMVGTGGDLTVGTLQGTVSALYDPYQIDYAGIQGELLLSPSYVTPGHYNVYITPASTDPAAGPGGYSYGTATVGKNGEVGVVLHLADGASPAITFSSFVAQDGSCPLYASLYGGKGVILGWLEFQLAPDDPNLTLQGAVNWVKLPVEDKYYTNGFASAPNIYVELYLPPKVGTNNYGWPGEYFVIDQGFFGSSLPDETDVALTFDSAKNTFSVTNNTNKVAIALTPGTGLLTGSFVDPTDSKTAYSYVGVDIDGYGYGFYMGTNKETGPIFIGIPEFLPAITVLESGVTASHNFSGAVPPEPPSLQFTPASEPPPPPP
jgi:hypothetical protein